MRVTSELFISALLRRAFAKGGYGAVLHKGRNRPAPSISASARNRLGLETLYGPAPQSFALDGDDAGVGDGRQFERRLQDVEAEAVEAVLARELRFDPDSWVIELEGEDAGDLIPLAGEEKPPNPAEDLFRR